MYRIETIEQIENHKSFNHVGVQILSMSKRIMNELICLAQDLEFRIYYQDTDSIHIEHKHIKELAIKYEEKYKKELIGKEFHQFHPDFEPCKLLINDKVNYNIIESINMKEESEITLSELGIFNKKKNYCDKKFALKSKKIKDFDINNIENIKAKINENIIDNYHPRMKGVNQECIPYTAYKHNMKIEELYLAGFNYDTINFDLSKTKPTFKFQKDFKVTNEQLNRNILTEGNRYVIGKDGIEYTILDNEWNRKNVTVDIEGNIIGEVRNEPMD